MTTRRSLAQRRRDDSWRHGNLTYAAERRAKNHGPTIPAREARQIVEWIVADRGWGPVTLKFYDNHKSGTGWAYRKDRVVALNRKGLTRTLVLHELAHIETPGDRGHGPTFRGAYLYLARIYLPRYAASLHESFRYYDLKVEMPNPNRTGTCGRCGTEIHTIIAGDGYPTWVDADGSGGGPVPELAPDPYARLTELEAACDAKNPTTTIDYLSLKTTLDQGFGYHTHRPGDARP